MIQKQHLRIYKIFYKKSKGDLKTTLKSIIKKLKNGKNNFSLQELYVSKTILQESKQRIQNDYR